MKWKELRTSINRELKSKLVPILRARGFTGSYPHFRRFRDEVIDVLGIQFSQWAPQFYIEIALATKDGVTLANGTHFPPKSVKHYHTGNRKRVGKASFNYEHDSPKQIVEQAIRCLDEAEVWWRTNYP